MSDHHISLEKSVAYGPEAATNLRALRGKQPELDAAIGFVADRIDAATTTLSAAMKAARTTDAQHRSATQAKNPALDEGHDYLVRLGNHLAGHKAGIVDRKTFFPKDGTASGEGKTATDVLRSLKDVIAALKGSKVSLATKWRNEAIRDRKALKAAVDQSKGSKQVRLTTETPAVEKAQTRWGKVYAAGKRLTEALAEITETEIPLSNVFPDLAVPAKRTKKSPPVAAPPGSATPLVAPTT